MIIKHPSNAITAITERQMRERFLAFIIFITGWLLLSFTIMRYELICLDKSPGISKRCTLQRTYTFVIQDKIPLGQVKHAYVQTYFADNKNSGWLYSVVLETSRGMISILPFPTMNKARKTKVANQIEDYLIYGKNLTIRLSNPQPRGAVFLFGFIMVLGLFLVSILDNITILINKEKKTLTITWKNLYRKKSKIFNFDDIKHVDVQSKLTRKGTRRHRLAIIHRDKSAFAFNNHYFWFFNYKLHVANKINHLLKIKAIIHRGEEVASSKMRTYIAVVVGLLFLAIVFFIF